MYSVLDIAGAFIYVIYRIIMLPLLVVLEVFFALLALFRYLQAGIHWLRSIRLHPLQSFIQLAKYRFSLGRRIYAWALHRG